jgi:hypothetical protein
MSLSRPPNILGCLIPADTLLGRWRLTLDLFGRVFCDDVGAEPGSIIGELGGFVVKEVKFRRDMERLRNSQQRDLTLEVGFEIQPGVVASECINLKICNTPNGKRPMNSESMYSKLRHLKAAGGV